MPKISLFSHPTMSISGADARHILRLSLDPYTLVKMENVSRHLQRQQLITLLRYICRGKEITLRIVRYHFSSRLTATLNLCLIYFKITWALAILLEHMHKKFEINQTKIKGGCQSRKKVVPHDSKSDLTLRPIQYLKKTTLLLNMSYVLNRYKYICGYVCRDWTCGTSELKSMPVPQKVSLLSFLVD